MFVLNAANELKCRVAAERSRRPPKRSLIEPAGSWTPEPPGSNGSRPSIIPIFWPGILPRPSPSHRSWWEAGTCGKERTGHGEMRCCLLCRSPTNGAPHLLGRCCGFPGPRPEISMCSCHIHFGTRLQLGEWERGASAPEPVFGGAPASRTSRLRGCCPQIPLQSSGPPLIVRAPEARANSFGAESSGKYLQGSHMLHRGDFRFPRPPWYGRAARMAWAPEPVKRLPDHSARST